ncbi:GBS Bsp-like repeat-containing protein [Paenibacillus tyrfis]|uniref:Ig-like domain-containing protein n=1 Tax=Paenibacillus tyrfis TaxID=1501230 RepID=A0A081P4G6_9BACL|nr:GBS Bsp-like repeat-containing protein [Paenibacillus tyrfis]KEQ25589.1 hypothetical protein ET33_02390 [Paenibacillus tyrfis]
MPYIESTAYKDGFGDFYQGTFKGTAPDLYVGQKGTNNYFASMAFNNLSIPQWSRMVKVEIMLVGADYVDGKTSGNLIVGALKDIWNENETSFRPGAVYRPTRIDWSPIVPGVTYSFDVTELAQTELFRDFFDGGILIMGDVLISGDSPGLLKFRSRESGSPPIIRYTYESDTTPPTVGSLTGTQYLKIQPNNTFRVWAYNVTDSWSGVSIVRFPTAGPGSDFQWRDGVRDGSNNWYCDIPINAYGNNEGLYTTHVYTYDNAGNNGFVGAISTYVDRTPPTVASVQGFSYTNQTGGTRRVWIYGVADAVSGITSVEAHYVKTGMNWNGPYAAGQSGGDFYFDAPVYAGDGEYLVHFYLWDRAGNQSGPHEVRFFVDSQRANDPNVSVTYGETAANFTWLRFSDPTPSSGYARTLFYLGEWTGSAWVGGAPNLFNGTVVSTDINVIEKHVNNLKPGVRYRYTVTHYDKAGNESAYTYREFVTKKQIWAMQYKAGLAQLSLAIYDPNSGVLGSKALRIATPAGIGCFELVGTDVTMTNFRVQTPQGVRTIN